jgi:phosphoesterase RecJ-like protein
MTTPDLEQEFRKLEKIIVTGRSFFLAGHLNPDGDTLGSMLAVSSVLRRLGKKIFLFSNDPVPASLGFLPHAKSIKIGRLPPKKRFDAAILLECSTPQRGGDLSTILKHAGKVVNIDHHKTSEFYGDVNIIEPHSSSTAEIVYRLLYSMKVHVTRTEAACLYVGIVTDTGRFHFPATSPRTLEVASRLLETGFNFSRINDLLYSTKSCQALKVLGRALGSLELVCGGRVAVMTLKTADFTDFGAAPEHTENIINYGMMAPGVGITVLFREEDGRVSVTFRSRGRADVSLLAKMFGGGGHKNASGCKMNTSMEDARKRILGEIRKHLNPKN